MCSENLCLYCSCMENLPQCVTSQICSALRNSREMPNNEKKNAKIPPQNPPPLLKCFPSYRITSPKLCLIPFIFLFLGLASINVVHSCRAQPSLAYLLHCANGLCTVVRARNICSEDNTEFGQTVHIYHWQTTDPLPLQSTKCPSVPLCLSRFCILGALPYWFKLLEFS